MRRRRKRRGEGARDATIRRRKQNILTSDPAGVGAIRFSLTLRVVYRHRIRRLCTAGGVVAALVVLLFPASALPSLLRVSSSSSSSKVGVVVVVLLSFVPSSFPHVLHTIHTPHTTDVECSSRQVTTPERHTHTHTHHTPDGPRRTACPALRACRPSQAGWGCRVRGAFRAGVGCVCGGPGGVFPPSAGRLSGDKECLFAQRFVLTLCGCVFVIWSQCKRGQRNSSETDALLIKVRTSS